MTFEINETKSKEFNNIEDLLKFADEEEKSIFRLPLKSFFDKGAAFIEDKGIGTPSYFYHFNQLSFENLCNIAGISSSVLKNIKEDGLSSNVLNDLFKNGNINKNFDTLEIVCDESNRQVIGFVSESYTGYSNKQFLEDLVKGLDSSDSQKSLFPSFKDFQFKQAYSVNSQMYFRIISQKVAGKVKGRGGSGDDVSEIGLQVSNTMAGGYALKIAYFVHRLICANGLTLSVSGDKGRLIHSGSKANFEKRLQNNIGSVVESLGTTVKTFNLLAGINFDGDKLAKNIDKKLIFQLINNIDLESLCEKRVLYRDYSVIEDKNERALKKLSDMIEEIPNQIGRHHSLAVFNSHFRDNASMWDFVNIFTEYAKELPIAERMETENRAGQLAEWISMNKRKF